MGTIIENRCGSCGLNHKVQQQYFPVGTIVKSISRIGNYLHNEIPIGSLGKVTSHCDDGRAWIFFDDYAEAGHTFHCIDDFVRIVKLPEQGPTPSNESPALRAEEGERVEHSPLPWSLRKNTSIITSANPLFGDVAIVVGRLEGGSLKSFRARANAKLILDAVNQHATLVAQRDRLLVALRTLVECSPCQNGCAPDDMSCATRLAEATITTIEQEGK